MLEYERLYGQEYEETPRAPIQKEISMQSPLNSQASLTKDEQEQENLKIEANIKELKNNMNKK
jgi:hypothetical protein